MHLVRSFAALAFLFALCAACAIPWPALPAREGQAFFLTPQQAYAATLSAASADDAPKNTVIRITAKERKAYKRAVAACMDYQNQPNPIVVDVSDLHLTKRQALDVGYLLHGNGELFWVNTYSDDSYGTDRFVLPCYFGDKKITKMRAKLDSVVVKARARLKRNMSAATKVHMLHDFVCNRVRYRVGQGKKDAYSGLVQRKGDCFSYALSLDLLLRRAGMKTDMAFNSRIDHAWNVVKVSGKWYHVDPTWDARNSRKNYGGNFNWTRKICHVFMLQSDETMNYYATDPATGKFFTERHSGWRCHHKCTSSKYTSMTRVRGSNGLFNRHCNDFR